MEATVLLEDTTLTDVSKTYLQIDTEYGEANMTFIINILEALPKNSTVQVELQFVSQLTDTLQGFYRTEYETEGRKKYKKNIIFNKKNLIVY